MSLGTTSVSVSVSSSHVKSLDLGDATFPISLTQAITLANGTGSGQADLIFTDTRTLTASATENLDLAGSLTDAYGVTMAFARIKAVIIAAATGNTNDVQVTRPASNGVPVFIAAGDGLSVRPGGLFAWACSDATGVVVTAATGDLLTITNSAGTTGVTYSVIIIGASA
jgi:hypothetical protein